LDSPALDVQGPADDALPLIDLVAATVDEFTPAAIEERGPGRVRVYFTSTTDRDAARAALDTQRGPTLQTSATSISDEDWAARSQADLQAIRVGRVLVAPPWDLPPATALDTDVVVQIRPALGFGSGHHPTTRLALLGLQQLDLRDRDVLDLGTGSGVLAIAAVKLGARRAIGIDRDPDALASARDSVSANDVAVRVELHVSDVSHQPPGSATVVVANLTGATLIALAPVITPLVPPGGHLVLGGILTTEADRVAEAYSARARLVWRDTEDEWVGMVWERKPR